MRTSAIYNLTLHDTNPEPNGRTSHGHSSVKGIVFLRLNPA